MRFSIITPSFNQGRYIQRTIDSVLEQDAVDCEYVVVDGGSTDQTLEILGRYDGRVKWVSERDRGHADAVNKGIRQTSGEIIGWLNSDDLYYPGTLQAVSAFMDANPTVDVVYGDADHIDPDDAFIEHYPTQDWNYQRLQEICFISQPAAFFRRRTVETYGLLDASLAYCMDYDYWLRLAQQGATFAYLPRLLAATRLHAEAATLAHRVACHMAINDITRRRLGRTPDRWLFNYAHAVVESWRDTESGRPRTTLALAAMALYAGMRWNHAISAPMLATLSRWIAADLTATLRRRTRPRTLTH